MLALMLLFLLVIAFSVYITVEAYYYQWLLGPGLERDLGFHEGSEYLRVGRRLHSAVAIKTAVENGPFASAGFVPETVLPGLSHTELFKRLHRGRVADRPEATGAATRARIRAVSSEAVRQRNRSGCPGENT
jgi:hypothetical protein